MAIARELSKVHSSLLLAYDEATQRIGLIDDILLPNAWKSESKTSALQNEKLQLQGEVQNVTKELMRYYVLHLSTGKEVELVGKLRDAAQLGNNPYLELDFDNLNPELIAEATWHIKVTPAVDLSEAAEQEVRDTIAALNLPSINMD